MSKPITKYEQMIVDHTDEPLDRKTADAIEDVLCCEYFNVYVDEDGNKDDKLSLTGNGFVAVSEELESLVDVFFPNGEETMVPTDTANYPDEEITLSDIRLDLMRYLDNRANRGEG